MAAAETLQIELVYCPALGVCDLVRLTLPAGATVADALQASDVLARHGLAAGVLRVGVWGRACEPGAVLRERDRIEIYRPLTVDPKEARRLRYQSHKESQKEKAGQSGRRGGDAAPQRQSDAITSRD